MCQPLLDAIKLFIKEDLSPRKSNPVLFIIFPLSGIIFSILLILLCEESFTIYSKELGLLVIFLIIALRVYPVYGVGWSSNSLYTKLRSERCTAQSVSYEVIIFLSAFLPVIIIISFDIIKF